MAEWKLCFVLLLPLTLSLDSEVTLVKTIGSRPDITPICPNSTNSIMLIVCKIRTKINCSLLYHFEKGFEGQCDSRFKLMTQNQTVFLHLTNLKSEDSGSYTCECSVAGGTFTLHLNVTVEEDEDAGSSTQTQTVIRNTLIGAGVVIMIAGVILGLFYRRTSCGKYELRDGSRSTTSGLPVSGTPQSLDQDDPDDPYASLQQPASDVYQTISNPDSKTVTVDSFNQEIDEEESDWSHTIYENVQTHDHQCYPQYL